MMRRSEKHGQNQSKNGKITGGFAGRSGSGAQLWFMDKLYPGFLPASPSNSHCVTAATVVNFEGSVASSQQEFGTPSIYPRG
jgi:hypothetical protein